MSEFTKGKWEYDEPLGVIYSDETNKVLATVYCAGTGSCFYLTPEGQANARLIAASPELYEIVRIFAYGSSEIKERIEEYCLALYEARKLLARIDGKEAEA